MKKLFFVIFILIMCFTASSFSETQQDSEMTFSGNLTIIQNGKKIKVSGSQNILIPKLEEFETQDDHPIVMADLFKENGFTKAEPALTIKTSKPFTISGKRIKGIFYLGKMENGDESVPALIKIGGEKEPFKIPARPRDYYVEIAMTEQELQQLLKDEGIEDENGELWLDYALLRYFKMRVTK